jgi:glycosyltransferase involved in cell wall biosynthesis
MRVAFISTSLDPGGAETVLTSLALGLHDAGDQVAVISLAGAGRLLSRLNANGVAARSLDATGLGGLVRALPGLVRELRRFAPDVVQGWMYHGNVVASALVPLCGGRLAWGVRQCLGAPERERAATNRLIRFSSRLSARPDHIVYNSERARADHEAIGYSPTNGAVIANGFDTATLRPNDSVRRRLRADLKLGDEVILVGHIARYHPVKDHETFLRAASRPEFRSVRAHLLMAGSGVDSSNEKLVSLIRQVGLEGRATLHGELEDITALLPGLDVLCLSSRSEAFPNVVGEAMSCGVPCITTDVGDAATIVGQTGLVAPPGDATQLSMALRAVAERGFEGRRRMGLAARERIERQYSMAAAIDQYKRLYERGRQQ